MAEWTEVQKHESEYWGNCLNFRTWGEFVKGEMYGREMGLFDDYGDGHGEFAMRGRSVLDVGGGPVSMTLRCWASGHLVVVDPCQWPDSVDRRYRRYGIKFIQARGEELDTLTLPDTLYDEVWLYNTLQHVEDPAKVVKNALARVAPGGKFRIFEWCYIPADDCHPHVLTPDCLLNWLTGTRILQVRIPRLKEFWSDATAFCGVFQR